MKKELEKVVNDLAKKAIKTEYAIEAMQYTQAVLNTMQTLTILKDTEKR